MNEDIVQSFWQSLKKIPSWIYEIGVLFLLSWVPFFWLDSSQVLLGHDSGFRLDMPTYLQSLWYSWNPTMGFGSDWTISKGFLVTQIPETFFVWATHSLSLGQRFSFVFWFFLISVSMYVFIRYFFKTKEFLILRMFSSTFYMYNFFLLQGWFINERAKFSLFSALPLGLLLLYQSLIERKNIVRNSTLFGLLFFCLNGGSSPPLYGAILVSFTTISLYSLITQLSEFGLKSFVRVIFNNLKVLCAFGLSTLLFNSYWVLPQIYLIKNQYSVALSAIGGINEILNWEHVVSKSASFLNLLRLQGIPDWYENPAHTFSSTFLTNPIFILASFVPIVLLLVVLLSQPLVKQKFPQAKLFFLMLCLLFVTIFFSAGSHPPFGFLYILLIKKLPGFAIFRSSIYKFGPGFWFSLIFLAGYSLNVLALRWRKNERQLRIVCIAAVVFVLGYHFPFFDGPVFDFDPPFTTRITLPPYVMAMKNYVGQHVALNDRFLMMPGLYTPFPVDSYSWGFWSFDMLPRLVFQQPVAVNLSGSPESIRFLYQAIDDHNLQLSNSLAQMYGVNYILWRSDILYHNKRTTATVFSNQRDFLQDSAFAKLEHVEGDWELYKVSSPSALLSIENQQVLMRDSVDLPTVLQLPEFVDKTPVVIEQKDLSPEMASQTDKSPKTVIVQPSCENCQIAIQQLSLPKVELPYVRFLPNSPFYPLILLKEKLLVFQARHSLSDMTDLRVLFLGKRMREITGSPRIDIGPTLTLYENLVNELKTDIERLPADEQLKRRLAFLAEEKLHLEEAEGAKTDARVIKYLAQNIKELEEIVNNGQIDYQKQLEDSWLNKNYTFEVSEAGRYRLSFGNNVPEGTKVLLDGKEVRENQELSLEQGSYGLSLDIPKEAVYSELKDGEPQTESEVITDAETKYVVNDISPNAEYVIFFDYKVPKEQTTTMSLFGESHQTKTPTLGRQKISDQLEPSNEWQNYMQRFDADGNDTQVSIFFRSLQGGNVSSSLELRNFSIRKLIQPTVVLVRDAGSVVSDVEHTSPVEFTNVDPTKFQLTMPVSQDPSFLLFKQSYNKDWRLYPAELPWWKALFTKPLFQATHLKVDTYANAWYIDPSNADVRENTTNGKLRLQLLYWPQALFYLATSITGLTFVLTLCFYLGRQLLQKRRHG